jgi:hypothetical protein
MKCGWGCVAQLTGRNMRAAGASRGARCAYDVASGPRVATMRKERLSRFARNGRQPPTTWADEGGDRRLSVNTRRGRECCAAGVAEPDSRRARCAPTSTPCPRWTAATDRMDRRGRSLKDKRGRPLGPRRRPRALNRPHPYPRRSPAIDPGARQRQGFAGFGSKRAVKWNS